MLQDTKRFISYICPHCRQSVIVERSAFSIAASPVHIKCPCGKSELRAEMLGDRVELEVPCLFCGHEHRVSCSSKAFLYQKALAFSCAASGLDCCYVGEEGPVYAATARLEQAVDKLETESAQQGAFLDELVMQGAAILMVSSDLQEILGMSDRIYVMSGGSVVGEIDGSEVEQSMVLNLAFSNV